MKKKNGFNLIELLAVVAIIALLASIVIPTVIRHYNIEFRNEQNKNGEQSVKNCCDVYGFTDVKIIDRAMARLTEDYQYYYRVSATNPKGKAVSFKVYWSSYLGSTIIVD